MEGPLVDYRNIITLAIDLVLAQPDWITITLDLKETTLVEIRLVYKQTASSQLSACVFMLSPTPK